MKICLRLSVINSHVNISMKCVDKCYFVSFIRCYLAPRFDWYSVCILRLSTLLSSICFDYRTNVMLYFIKYFLYLKCYLRISSFRFFVKSLYCAFFVCFFFSLDFYHKSKISCWSHAYELLLDTIYNFFLSELMQGKILLPKAKLGE